MIVTHTYLDRQPALSGLVEATFTASEGADEGALVGQLARDLLSDTPADDIRVFVAEAEDTPIGVAIFTRLTYPEDSLSAFLLSPMAVAPAWQGQGVGQGLLTRALAALRDEGIELALTYGDPDYYARVGFKPITEAQAKAPVPLTMPQGWIGQALSGGPFPDLKGPSTCVPALNRPDIW